MGTASSALSLVRLAAVPWPDARACSASDDVWIVSIDDLGERHSGVTRDGNQPEMIIVRLRGLYGDRCEVCGALGVIVVQFVALTP
jgi:hypothetical protein